MADAPTVITLPLKWRADAFDVVLPPSSTVADAKAAVATRTGVPAATVKLVGLKTVAGALASDATLLADVAPARPGARFMVLGTPAAAAAALATAAEAAPALADESEGEEDGAADDGDVDPRVCPDAQAKLARRIDAFTLTLRRPLRVDKRLLVLDIDYTLFDLNSTAETPAELARPHLHAFLAAAHEHYEIVIWSATNMKWVEVKMEELGCADHPAFSLACYLDHRAMVTVRTARHGVFNAKPLPLLWAKLAAASGGVAHWGPHNTLMLDDLKRNYVFNPECGLVIKPYKRAATSRHTDDELARLAEYVTAIARLPTFEGLVHRRWEKWMRREGRRLLAEADAEERGQGGAGGGE
jgi:ubiquitin-like domain-containing CTD phosphatase 1